jgi:hypothetical protein
MNRSRLLALAFLAQVAALGGPACTDGGVRDAGGGDRADASNDASTPPDALDAADAIELADAKDASPDRDTTDVPIGDAPVVDAPDTDAPGDVATSPDASVIGEWAVLVHDDSNDDIDAIATFPDGSSIVSGSILQPGSLVGAPTTPGAFLMRLNADGTPAWIQIGREPSVKALVARGLT